MTRADYAADPTFLTDVLELLGTVFGDWFTRCEAAGRAHGLRWDVSSTPFVVRERGRAVAHAGVLELPLVLQGEERVVAGLHAVATHPDHRGRGFMRRVVEDALRYCDERYETVVLTAGEPAVYERFGFAVRPEHRFVCDAPPASGVAGHRPLDWDSAEDLALLHALLRDRAAVSQQLGVVRERDVFLFDTALSKDLHVFEELDIVAWMTRSGGALHLHDLVARRVPTLEELLGHVAAPVDRVATFFCPDRLRASFRTERSVFDGDEWFMTRGPFLPGSVDITLPRSARC